MDTAMLVAVFVAALAVSGFATLAFSAPIDDALRPVIPAQMADAWGRCVKFALFTASFVGGLRLPDLGALTARGAGEAVRMGADQGLIETYRTIAGSLSAAAWALLAFFGATLCAYAATRVYEAIKPSGMRRAGDRHGAERHPTLPV